MSATHALSAVEEKYRTIVGELALLLAKERLPDADGETILTAATQIVDDYYAKHGLPPLPIGGAT
jgi:hypothetical protein